MTDWISAVERLPELGPDGKSDLVVFDAGKSRVGRLVREKNGLLWWTPEDGSRQVPEPTPGGLGAARRWVRRWRPAARLL